MQGDSSGSKRAGQGETRQRIPGADRIVHSLSLLVAMFATWLLLSGFFHAFLLTLGVISCVIVVAIALRMDVVDHESFPIHLTFRIPLYWAWLFKEIWLAAVDVTKRVFSPSTISPTLIELDTTQHSELGQVIYANSITLTPGTYTIRIFGDKLLVHALSKEGADGLATGEMDRRVTELEAK